MDIGTLVSTLFGGAFGPLLFVILGLGGIALPALIGRVRF